MCTPTIRSEFKPAILVFDHPLIGLLLNLKADLNYVLFLSESFPNHLRSLHNPSIYPQSLPNSLVFFSPPNLSFPLSKVVVFLWELCQCQSIPVFELIHSFSSKHIFYPRPEYQRFVIGSLIVFNSLTTYTIFTFCLIGLTRSVVSHPCRIPRIHSFPEQNHNFSYTKLHKELTHLQRLQSTFKFYPLTNSITHIHMITL